MTALLTPAQLRQRFVLEATHKFAANVSDFVALQHLVRSRGGSFRNDHGAIRTADPAVFELFLRAAQVLGLRREREYRFPAKKLVSCDLQVIGEDASQFKIFVSQVDLAAFPETVAERIRQDAAEQAAAVDHAPFLALIEHFERRGGLDEDEAGRFIQHFVHRLMQRNGPPLRRRTLQAVAEISGEAASALALGPDFNHVTIDVIAAGYSGIEAMAAAMLEAGFRLLPQIQGAPNSPLRQTATMAATIDTAVIEDDGRVGRAPTEKQFVEIIERSQALDARGHPMWRENGQPLIFRNFLATNAEKIFDAASTRAAVC